MGQRSVYVSERQAREARLSEILKQNRQNDMEERCSKDRQYAQTRMTKRAKKRRDNLRVVAFLLVVPASVTVMVGIAVCLCAMSPAIGGDTVFWEQRKKYRIIGPFILSGGSLIGLCTYVLYKWTRTGPQRLQFESIAMPISQTSSDVNKHESSSPISSSVVSNEATDLENYVGSALGTSGNSGDSSQTSRYKRSYESVHYNKLHNSLGNCGSKSPSGYTRVPLLLDDIRRFSPVEHNTVHNVIDYNRSQNAFEDNSFPMHHLQQDSNEALVMDDLTSQPDDSDFTDEYMTPRNGSESCSSRRKLLPEDKHIRDDTHVEWYPVCKRQISLGNIPPLRCTDHSQRLVTYEMAVQQRENVANRFAAPYRNATLVYTKPPDGGARVRIAGPEDREDESDDTDCNIRSFDDGYFGNSTGNLDNQYHMGTRNRPSHLNHVGSKSFTGPYSQSANDLSSYSRERDPDRFMLVNTSPPRRKRRTHSQTTDSHHTDLLENYPDYLMKGKSVDGDSVPSNSKGDKFIYPLPDSLAEDCSPAVRLERLSQMLDDVLGGALDFLNRNEPPQEVHSEIDGAACDSPVTKPPDCSDQVRSSASCPIVINLLTEHSGEQYNSQKEIQRINADNSATAPILHQEPKRIRDPATLPYNCTPILPRDYGHAGVGYKNSSLNGTLPVQNYPEPIHLGVSGVGKNQAKYRQEQENVIHRQSPRLLGRTSSISDNTGCNTKFFIGDDPRTALNVVQSERCSDIEIAPQETDLNNLSSVYSRENHASSSYHCNVTPVAQRKILTRQGRVTPSKVTTV